MRSPPADCLRFQYSSTSSRVLARVVVTLVMTAVSLGLILGLAVEVTTAAAAPASVARTDHPRMYCSAAAAATEAVGARALPAASWPPGTSTAFVPGHGEDRWWVSSGRVTAKTRRPLTPPSGPSDGGHM
ncbi:hypothetical protein ABZP36_027584 [Zizania latifolia]